MVEQQQEKQKRWCNENLEKRSSVESDERESSSSSSSSFHLDWPMDFVDPNDFEVELNRRKQTSSFFIDEEKKKEIPFYFESFDNNVERILCKSPEKFNEKKRNRFG